MNTRLFPIPSSLKPHRPSSSIFWIPTQARRTRSCRFRCFSSEEFAFRPHPRSKTVFDIVKHQLLSERSFFAEFMDCLSRRHARCRRTKIRKSMSRACATSPNRAPTAFSYQTDRTVVVGAGSFFRCYQGKDFLAPALAHLASSHSAHALPYRMMNKSVPSPYWPNCGCDLGRSRSNADRRSSKPQITPGNESRPRFAANNPGTKIRARPIGTRAASNGLAEPESLVTFPRSLDLLRLRGEPN